MSTAVRESAANPGAVVPIGDITRVLVQGDLSQLTEPQRVAYYHRICDSLGLNPLTQPFQFLLLGKGDDRKLVLYATKACTEQVRFNHDVSVKIAARETIAGAYVVTAVATLPNGRTDESTGAVALERENGEWKKSSSGKSYFAGNGTFEPLRGEALANAMMKAETKAKRRVTLSICGLGVLDESEIESIPEARVVPAPRGAVADRPAPAGPPPEKLAELRAMIDRVAEAEGADPGDLAARALRAAGCAALEALPADKFNGLMASLRKRLPAAAAEPAGEDRGDAYEPEPAGAAA